MKTSTSRFGSGESLESARGNKPRVAADVALALLEVIQQQDHPGEVFQDENVSETMPRRLGLSEVVDRQVRLQRENAKKGHRLTDAELTELIRLVLRRPDSPEIFSNNLRKSALVCSSKREMPISTAFISLPKMANANPMTVM